MQDIAKTIRRGWSPELMKAMQLPEQAQRLDRALKVAVRWMEVAREGAPEMFHEAEYTRDKIEEELARVCFEMAVETEAKREKASPSRDCTDEDLTAIARSAALSETLLRTYCTLRDLETDLFGDGPREHSWWLRTPPTQSPRLGGEASAKEGFGLANSPGRGPGEAYRWGSGLYLARGEYVPTGAGGGPRPFP